MSTTVSDTGSFNPIPEGNFIARCYGVVDVGTQHDKTWDRWVPKVFFLWEVLDDSCEPRDDGGPQIINRKYTASLSEKSHLRQDLERWRSKAFTAKELEGFSLKKVLGQYALIQIIHNEQGSKVFANINNVTTIPPAMKKQGLPDPVNNDLFFDIDQSGPEDVAALPEWLGKIVLESKEYQGKKSDPPPDDYPGGPEDDFEDDIPF